MTGLCAEFLSATEINAYSPLRSKFDIIKNILLYLKKNSHISFDNKSTPSDDHIHFVPNWLIQFLPLECYKYQIIINNTSIHKLTIIIYNIHFEILQTKHFHSQKDDSCLNGVVKTHMTDSNGKWIIPTTKARKDAATIVVDKFIENSNAPNTTPNKRPELSTKYNVNSTLIIYTVVLQQDVNPTDTAKKIQTIGVQNRNFQISYDRILSIDFLLSGKKKSETFFIRWNKRILNDNTNEISTVDTNSDKFQSMTEVNNKTIKGGILLIFNSEL